MMVLSRPTTQPVSMRMILVLFIVLSIILAIATGYYHQRWQNQLKRTARVQKQLDVLMATSSAALKVDSAPTNK